MPRYEVRLESTDAMRDDGSPHFRVTRLTAGSEVEAERVCRRMEFRRCGFFLNDEELERIEAVEADPERTLAGQDKGRLYAHRQEVPYQVVSVTEVPGRDNDAAPGAGGEE